MRNPKKRIKKVKEVPKPSTEAKALSLFLMAYKTKDNKYKEKAKRINRQWDLLQIGEISIEDYQNEVTEMLNADGGYSEVVEKTVKYYIEKTGEWKSQGDDKYCVDAKAIADSILKK